MDRYKNGELNKEDMPSRSDINEKDKFAFQYKHEWEVKNDRSNNRRHSWITV